MQLFVYELQDTGWVSAIGFLLLACGTAAAGAVVNHWFGGNRIRDRLERTRPRNPRTGLRIFAAGFITAVLGVALIPFG